MCITFIKDKSKTQCNIRILSGTFFVLSEYSVQTDVN